MALRKQYCHNLLNDRNRRIIRTLVEDFPSTFPSDTVAICVEDIGSVVGREERASAAPGNNQVLVIDEEEGCGIIVGWLASVQGQMPSTLDDPLEYGRCFPRHPIGPSDPRKIFFFFFYQFVSHTLDDS